jgi:hypothetical protein
MADSTSDYVALTFKAGSFTCPHCHVLTGHTWGGPSMFKRSADGLAVTHTTCQSEDCQRIALWVGPLVKDPEADTDLMVLDMELVWPPISAGPPPNPDLPSDISADVEEARQVLGESPRAAAALLRLALQKLTVHLDQPGENLYTDIGALVAGGLRIDTQQAMDILRLTGNGALHPSDIDAGDPATVMQLFDLVNLIAYDTLTRPKQLQDLYASMPPDKLKGIENRDKPKD